MKKFIGVFIVLTITGCAASPKFLTEKAVIAKSLTIEEDTQVCLAVTVDHPGSYIIFSTEKHADICDDFK